MNSIQIHRIYYNIQDFLQITDYYIPESFLQWFHNRKTIKNHSSTMASHYNNYPSVTFEVIH